MLAKNLDIKDGRFIIKDEDKEDFVATGQDKIMTAMIQLFAREEPIKDYADIHGLAEELDIEAEKLEEKIYGLLQSFLSKGRFMEKGNIDKIDKKQLTMGIKVEMEHTDNPLIARRIALDHLTEISDYYDRLNKMEKEAGE